MIFVKQAGLKPTVLWLLVTSALVNVSLAAPDISASDQQFFESRIRPVLVENCYKCHSIEGGKRRGGLLLDSAWGWQQGGDSGTAIVPGDAAASRLMHMIKRDPEVEPMPPKSALPAQAVLDLEKWIAMGAPDPRPKVEGVTEVENDFDLEERKDWWSLQPVQRPEPPTPSDTSWAKTPIDQFVLHTLESQKMKPAPPAERRAWIRRVTFGLTGLPPEPNEVEIFVDDQSSDAREKVVDRLLKSRRFGEHWARHWMDLVRYAETKAFEQDYTMPNAYRYRDYLIRAFNDDVPYNQFVLEALAGDLLPQPRIHCETGQNESVVGPGFVYLTDGQHGPPDIREDEARVFDGMIDTISKTFLGKTIACARCHDHKFDAITAADYYSLYGLLAGSRLDHVNINPPEELEKAREALATQKNKVRHELAFVLEDFLKKHADTATKAVKKAGIERYPVPNLDRVDKEAPFKWHVSGRAFGDGPQDAGAFIPQHDGDKVIATFAGNQRAAGALGSRFGGSIKSSDFLLSGEPIRVRVKGKSARVTLYVRHYELVGRGPTTNGLTKIVNNDQWQWITFATDLWKGETAYLEICHNGGELDFVQGAQHHPKHVDGSYAVVGPVCQGAPCKPDKRPVENVAEQLASLPEAWRSGKLNPAQTTLLDALVTSGTFAPSIDASPGLKSETERLRQLQASVPEPVYARSLSDGGGVDQPIFIRGLSHNISTKPNPRHFMDALAPEPFESKGSGRYEWAQHVASSDNPLTARVMVNRLWHHLFGRGIVGSVDDFGKMGEPPSHPELLDYLASEFVQSGWSIKKAIRSMVLTNTYAMSSEASELSLKTDPNNLYLQHMPVRRLGAEAVRDTILTMSGELNLAMFGQGVAVNLNETNPSRARPRKSGPLDGDGRRSVYLEMRRSYLPGFLLAFDMPIASETFGRRNITNVPAQSLALMNDPFVHGQAKAWAQRLLKKGSLTWEQRIDHMHRHAFARSATSDEQSWAGELLAGLAEDHGLSKEQAMNHLGVWSDFCHIMLNRKELIYVY